jgi:hypothetical protein
LLLSKLSPFLGEKELDLLSFLLSLRFDFFLSLPCSEVLEDVLKLREDRLGKELGTSILLRMTKQTPKTEFIRLKKPINIDIAISSTIPGRTAWHSEFLNCKYGCSISPIKRQLS